MRHFISFGIIATLTVLTWAFRAQRRRAASSPNQTA
jgi:hypothetical protein